MSIIWADVSPQVPRSWSIRGHIPLWDDLAAIGDDEMLDLGADLLQIRAQNFVIDIGWAPEARRDGRFVCVVVQDERWDNPVMRRHTANPDEVLANWLPEAIHRVRSELRFLTSEPPAFVTTSVQMPESDEVVAL